MISLIITVFNEKDNLPKWFESISEQSQQPDEIIVVDGGSTDGTWKLLVERVKNSQAIKVFQKKSNIAEGRNYAIAQAKGEVIVATDAGCVYGVDWFKKITFPIIQKQARWSATAFGPWLNQDDSGLLFAIAAATTPAKSEFVKDWLPSSRSVAFEKELWHTVGGYPEWIPYCEDVIFDLEIRKKFGKPFYVREPLVFWRPRNSFSKYLRQLYNYTRSEGHGKLNFWRQIVRYFVYIGTLLLLVFGVSWNIWWSLPIIVGALVYLRKFVRRWSVFTRNKPKLFQLSGAITVPVVVALGDIAKMIGYPVGVWERLKGRIN